MFRKALGVLVLAGTCASPASAAVIYMQDFESAGSTVPSGWTGAGFIAPSEGLNPFGFGRQHLLNDGSGVTTLTVNSAASHSTATVSFDLAFWDSVDQGGDAFRVLLNGVAIIDVNNFGNYFGAFSGPGTLLTADHTGQFSVPNYGRNSGYRDQARRFTTTVAHSADQLTLSFQYPNSQGGFDESFGIDNVKVEINSRTTPNVPEPTGLALLGLAGVFAARRRRA